MSKPDSAAVVDIAAALEPPPGWDGIPLPLRARIGQRAHQALRADFAEEEREVALAAQFEGAGGELLRIHGRCDGLVTRQNDAMVVEFKSAALPQGALGSVHLEPPPRYAFQVKLYGYLAWKSLELPPSSVRCLLRVVNLTDGERRDFELDWSPAEVERRLDEFIMRRKEAKSLRFALEQRRRSLSADLPWPLKNDRPHQAEMARLVQAALQDGRDLLIEAPTGFGKTFGVLHPALKFSLQRGGRLFFATARSSGRSAATTAIEAMNEAGAQVKTLVLPARVRLCRAPVEPCGGAGCYFGETPAADVVPPRETSERLMVTERELLQDAKSAGLCPAALAHALLEQVDVVVGDYNFVFDPAVQLPAFRPPKQTDWTLLADEAHNLLERGCEMFSAELDIEALSALEASLELERWQFSSASAYVRLQSAVSEWCGLVQDCLSEAPIGAATVLFTDEERIFRASDEYSEAMAALLVEAGERLDEELKGRLWRFLDEQLALASALKRDRESHPLVANAGKGTVGALCLDPSAALGEVFERVRAFVGFSGTLTPLPFFRDALGLGVRPVECLEFPEVYAREQRLIIVPKGCSTRYPDRARTASAIAGTLEQFLRLRPGGYLVVFPSFEFLQMVKVKMSGGGVQIVEQTPRMTEPERARVRASLSVKGSSTAALVVAGGQFAEAVDYPGDDCVGVAIVGPCLPPPAPFREAMKAYWTRRGENGVVAAYLIPAVRRVVQAAGRLLRSEDDRGVLLLLDYRFLEEPILSLLPRSWRDEIQTPDDWVTAVDKFWKHA